jgi:uncharacterized protein (TIGR03437 family)
LLKRISLVFCSLLLLVPAAPGRQPPEVCGTHRESGPEALALHRQSMRRILALKATGLMAASGTSLRQAGNIVIMDDGDGVVARRNIFNLDKRTLTFHPLNAAASTYTYVLGDASYDTAAAAAGQPLQALGDDDSRRVALPFTLPFYGASYRELWINSDGNLTFEEPDSSTASRSLGRFTAGPPRIAPLFDDLDPSRAGSVRLTSDSSRVVITWADVPEYSDFGTGRLQRFQIRLYPNGRIEFAWDGTNPGDAITGITPGRLQGSASIVSFTTTTPAQYTSTVAERFSSTDSIDTVRVAQRFYEQFEDAYDYLVVYNRVGLQPSPGALAAETTVRSHRMGIGDTPVEVGALYGSTSRLQSMLNMGPLSQYPADPYGKVGGRGQITGDTSMSILGHETGHLFLALASIRDPADPAARPMLGAQNAHWSFNFNSEASLLEGNRINDRGAQAQPRFETTATVEGYAPLDQYLMGFRAPEEVAPVFLVRGTGIRNDRFPQVGVQFSGVRQDIRVEDIIAAEGRRVPDYTVEQRRFRFGFVLITAAGDDPAQIEIDKLENFRQEFERYYVRVASERATADAALKRSLKLSAFPAGGVIAGRPARVIFTVQTPPQKDLAIALKINTPWFTSDSSVTIKAGARTAEWALPDMQPGVYDLTAVPDDNAYESGAAKIQVSASAASLHLQQAESFKTPLTPGEAQQLSVAIRVADQNDVPYQGLAVLAKAEGTLQNNRAVTDEKGIARFNWTTPTGLVRALTATLEENPQATLTVGVPGPPVGAANGVVNAAGYQAGGSPGMLASLFGFNLWNGLTAAASWPWPFSLDGVEIKVNGVNAPLYYVSLTQLNFLLPEILPPGPADIMVSNSLGASAAVRVNITETLPGIFFDAASGQAAVRQNGRFFEVYGTGLGALNPPDGQGVITTVLPVTVRVAGQQARVLFSGISGRMVGLNQVNIELPAGLGAGTYPLQWECGGVLSNTVQLKVQ